MIMALTQLLIVLCVVGVIWWVWWVARTYIPGPPPIKIIIDVVCALVVVLILLEAFGPIGIPHIRVG